MHMHTVSSQSAETASIMITYVEMSSHMTALQIAVQDQSNSLPKKDLS